MRVDPSIYYITGLPEHQLLGAQALSVQESTAHYRLLVVGAGGHDLLDKSGQSHHVDTAAVYLIPIGHICALKSCASELHLLTMSFRAHTALCSGHCPTPKSAPRRRGLVGEVRDTSLSAAPTRVRPRRPMSTVTSLPLTKGLSLWFEGMVYLLEHTGVEERVYDRKLEEFFYLLNLDYARADIDAFLAHYHCRIEGFRELVMSTLEPRTEVADLYKQGEKLGLNEVAFKRTFIEEYGQSPREWLSEQRARLLYKELALADKPFKELSDEFGFCSVSHFGAFCKQMLGDTPLHIRKNIRQGAKIG